MRARPRALLAALLGLLLVLPATPAGAASTGAVPGPVVVVGTGGLRWDDVTREATPALWSLLEQGSVGDLAVRSVRRQACPVDGWLALSAGRRAADAVTAAGEGSCREPVGPDGATTPVPLVPRWDVYLAEAAAASFESEPGMLGDALADAGVDAAALGPGAAIALAGRDGVVRGSYAARPGTLPLLTGATADLLDGGAELLVVDVGALRDPADRFRGTARDPLAPGRAEQVADIDARVGAVLDAVPDGATVLVASMADSGATPHLQLLAALGPAVGAHDYGPGLLGSRSTRQNGLAQTTDVAPTVLELLGVPSPGGLVGSPVRHLEGSAAPASERLEVVLDLERAALAVQPLVPRFFLGLEIAQLVLYGAGALALRRHGGGRAGRRRVYRWLRWTATVFAAVPVSTYLANVVPWWRTDNDLAAVVAAVTVPVLLICAVALLGPWRHAILGPFGIVAGATAIVLAADVLTGSRLQLSSLMGLQPVVAGRFYGFGNVAFALFATGALLAATAVADALVRRGRRAAAATAVAVIGVVAVVVDGAPGLGSDFGGPPAMVPAFTLLALLVAGVAITVRRAIAIAVGTIVVVLSLSVVDWLRPADQRTHLGRFVDTVIAGGAWPVIQRKAEQNLTILVSNWGLSLLVPLAAVFVAVVLLRPATWGAAPLQRAYDRSPALRPGLVAFLVLQAIGFAVNDSGTAVPAVAATLLIPLLIAASVRALEIDLNGGAAGRPPRDRSATAAAR